jgi:hypothetical protein
LSDQFIEVAALKYMDNVIGADVFRNTEVDSFADYAVYWLELLMELRAHKLTMDALPGVTRNDASAGLPLTRPTWNGLVASMIGLPVPLISLHLADLFSTPITLMPSNPLYGYAPLYYYPLAPTYQAAEFETALSNAAGEYDGLAGSNQLNKLTVPFMSQFVQYREPIRRLSTIGQMIQLYYPAADDAAESKQVRGATFDIMFNRELGLYDSHFDYIGAYCIGSTAAWDFIDNTAGAADKVNAEYAAVGDTAFTDVPDFADDNNTNLAMVGWMLQHNTLAGGSGFEAQKVAPHCQALNIHSGENAMTRRMIMAASRDLGMPYTTRPGLIQRLRPSDAQALSNSVQLTQGGNVVYREADSSHNSGTSPDTSPTDEKKGTGGNPWGKKSPAPGDSWF